MAARGKAQARSRAAAARKGTYERSAVGKASLKARERLTVRVAKTDVVHNQRQFRSLDRAIDFAASLPEDQASYILGHGDYNNVSKYKGNIGGYAALSDLAMGGYYRLSRDDIKDEESNIFKGGQARSYTVRWRDIRA